MIKAKIFCCFWLLASCLVALAQNTTTDSVAYAIQLENVVVTAQYAPTDSRNAVHSIRVIKHEDIVKRGVVNLEQLLQQELNIRVSNDLILGSSIDLQGVSGQNIQIMIDGVPIIGRLGDDIDLGQVNLSNIDRVEIVDAPLSVSYGTNALGGVINLITKKTQLHKFNTQFEVQNESLGRTNLNATLGVRPIKNALVRLHGGYNNFEGFDSNADTSATQARSYQWNPKEQYYIGASARYDFGQQQLRYSFNSFNEEIKNLGVIKRPQFLPYAFDDYYKTYRYEHALHHEGYVSDELFLKTTAGYNYFKRNKRTYRFDFDTQEQSELVGGQDTTRFEAFVFRPTLASNFKASKIDFQIGVDVRFDKIYGKRINDTTSTKARYSDIGDYALFASAKLTPFDRLILQFGGRLANNTRFDAPVTPSINVKYLITDELSLRASYAKGFRSPSLKELFFYFVDANHFILGNAALNAEVSNNYKLVVDWQTKFKENTIEVLATGFYNDIQEKIDLYEYVEVDNQLVPAASVGQVSNKYAYFNQSSYKTLGGNLQIRADFNDFGVNLGYAPIGRYNVLSETIDDVEDFTFLYEVNGEVSYYFAKQELQLSLFMRYNDRLIRYYKDFDSEGNAVVAQFVQDGFTLADATVSKYFWHKRLHLMGGVQNLFNVRNVPLSGGYGGAHSGGGGSVPVGMGRAWFARLGWHFGWGNV